MTASRLAGGDLATVAEIWATVELERALAEHGHNPRLAVSAVADPLLGGRVVVIEDIDDEDEDRDHDGDEHVRSVALAEPSTEGRLAASLARNGEGPAGRYASVPEGDTLAAFRARAIASGLGISTVAEGPFGPSTLLLEGPVGGPHLIVVEHRSLPSRP